MNSSQNLHALLERIRTSTDWEDREAAIRELDGHNSHDDRILPLMRQVMQELDYHAEELIEDSEIDLESVGEAIEAVILSFGEAALPHLREWSKDPSPIMRSDAVSLLANLAMTHQTAAPIPDLIAMLEVERDPYVQHMLTTTLEMIGTPEALDAIAKWQGHH